MNTYTFTETEKGMLQEIDAAFKKAHQNVEQLKKQLREQEDGLQGLQASYRNIAILVARQQGLVKTGNEQVTVSDDLSSLSVQ